MWREEQDVFGVKPRIILISPYRQIVVFCSVAFLANLKYCVTDSAKVRSLERANSNTHANVTFYYVQYRLYVSQWHDLTMMLH